MDKVGNLFQSSSFLRPSQRSRPPLPIPTLRNSSHLPHHVRGNTLNTLKNRLGVQKGLPGFKSQLHHSVVCLGSNWFTYLEEGHLQFLLPSTMLSLQTDTCQHCSLTQVLSGHKNQHFSFSPWGETTGWERHSCTAVNAGTHCHRSLGILRSTEAGLLDKVSKVAASCFLGHQLGFWMQLLPLSLLQGFLEPPARMLCWAGFRFGRPRHKAAQHPAHNLIKHKLVFALTLNVGYSTVVPKTDQILDWLPPGNVKLLSHTVTNLHDSSLARRPLKAE